jgi:hypothetical protein
MFHWATVQFFLLLPLQLQPESERSRLAVSYRTAAKRSHRQSRHTATPVRFIYFQIFIVFNFYINFDYLFYLKINKYNMIYYIM